MKYDRTLSHCRRKPDAGGFSAPRPVKRGGIIFKFIAGLLPFSHPNPAVPLPLLQQCHYVIDASRRRHRQATFCVVESRPACFQFDSQGQKERHIFFPPRILFCCTANELLITPEGLSFGGNVYIFLSLVGFVGSRFHKRVVGKA